MKKSAYFLSGIFAALISSAAQATVIDFEAATPLYDTQTMIAYNGFEFSNPFTQLWKFDADTHPYYNESYSGANNQTTFLAFSSSSGSLNITQEGGGAFNLSSLDLGLGYFNDSIISSTVSLSGSQIGGGFVSQSFQINKTFQTFNLGFTNLVSFSITSSGPVYLVTDNISVTAVPEPTSLALLMLGLGIVGVTVSRRRKQ